jgi:hypothetical protein
VRDLRGPAARCDVSKHTFDRRIETADIHFSETVGEGLLCLIHLDKEIDAMKTQSFQPPVSRYRASWFAGSFIAAAITLERFWYSFQNGSDRVIRRVL